MFRKKRYKYLEKLYKKRRKFIKQNSDCHIIGLGALLKGAKPFSHTAFVVSYGNTPRLFESKGSGGRFKSFYESFFRPSFRGKVVLQTIPCKLTEKDRDYLRKYVESVELGASFNILTALKAFFDLNTKQDKNKNFCTAVFLDVVREVKNIKLFKNHQNTEPHELVTRIEGIKGSKYFIARETGVFTSQDRAENVS
jgi:hypothetical protein